MTANVMENIQTNDAEYYRNKAAQVQLEIENSDLTENQLRRKELDLRVYESIIQKAEKQQERQKNYMKVMFFYNIFQ